MDARPEPSTRLAGHRRLQWRARPASRAMTALASSGSCATARVPLSLERLHVLRDSATLASENPGLIYRLAQPDLTVEPRWCSRRSSWWNESSGLSRLRGVHRHRLPQGPSAQSSTSPRRRRHRPQRSRDQEARLPHCFVEFAGSSLASVKVHEFPNRLSNSNATCWWLAPERRRFGELPRGFAKSMDGGARPRGQMFDME